MQLAGIDIAAIAIYAVAIFALAQWVSRGTRGEHKDSADYFLASRSLPWWAVGSSLIAANISAEQIVGMSGSGYQIGLAIASYEWMAALALLIVGKYFLPIFLANRIYTMPQFLDERYGPNIRTLMAVFWLGLYVFVNLTSIIWLGSLAVTKVAGVNQDLALAGLGAFALLYQLRGGLKAVALTDIVQVTLLVLGGLLVSGLTLNEIGAGQGMLAGFATLAERAPEKFDMILSADNPFYKDLPGLSVLLGGMWIANLTYWGFNQYIIQRALAAKSLREAQKGIIFAAFLKLLMPVIVVLPGIAAVVLAPDLARPDEAYPTMMGLLPPGILGVVFAALVAAIIASTASKINSVATIFTLDLYAKFRPAKDDVPAPDGDVSNPAVDEHASAAQAARERELVRVGRIAAVVATLLAIATARPLLGNFDQAFQFIQEYSGFFTPGIAVIFLLGLFWASATEESAIAAAIGSFVLSLVLRQAWPDLPFLDRMAIVFMVTLAVAVGISLLRPAPRASNRIATTDVSYATSAGFNIGSLGVMAILAALYAIWW